MKFTFIRLYEPEGPPSGSDGFIEEDGKGARRLAGSLRDYMKERIIATFKCLRMVVSG